MHAALFSLEGMGKKAEQVAPWQSFATLVASNMLHARYKPLSFVGSEFLCLIQNIYVHIAPGEGQSKQGRGRGRVLEGTNCSEVRLVPLALPHVSHDVTNANRVPIFITSSFTCSSHEGVPVSTVA